MVYKTAPATAEQSQARANKQQKNKTAIKFTIQISKVKILKTSNISFCKTWVGVYKNGASNGSAITSESKQATIEKQTNSKIRISNLEDELQSMRSGARQLAASLPAYAEQAKQRPVALPRSRLITSNSRAASSKPAGVCRAGKAKA